MAEEENNIRNISQAKSLEELAEFWDTHDVTDFEGETHAVDITFDLDVRRHYVAIDPDLLASVRQMAAARGLSAESLINLWLQERLLAQQ